MFALYHCCCKKYRFIVVNIYQCKLVNQNKHLTFLITHFFSSTRAMIPEARAAALEVPLKSEQMLLYEVVS